MSEAIRGRRRFLQESLLGLPLMAQGSSQGAALPLYFFEVNAGHQTMAFRPTDYVDITPVSDVKRRALVAHESQDGAAIDRNHHDPMARFRGREIGVTFAEAFVRLSLARAGTYLPGLS